MTTSSKTNKSRKDKIEKIKPYSKLKNMGLYDVIPMTVGDAIIILDKLNEIIDKLNNL